LFFLKALKIHFYKHEEKTKQKMRSICGLNFCEVPIKESATLTFIVRGAISSSPQQSKHRP